jgi:type IV pilus assembly protein PilV
MLIETLISLLLFSLGVVGIVQMQAAAVGLAGDAKFRSDAALLANQMVGLMWADQRANLPSYAHQASGTTCNFSGAASGNGKVTSWIGTASTLGTVLGSLPGGSTSYQQILVDATNTVKITICWRTPKDNVPHNYVLVTQIQGGT